MRSVILGLAVLALAVSPAAAQWTTRPAPSSWNLPQAPSNARVSAHLSQTSKLEDALICSAALQIATMAAPSWSRERGIAHVTNAWLQQVFVLSEANGISGDKVPGLVEAEMQRQTDSAARNPSTLSRQAFDCASRAPA